jgi:hypothetical protein
VNDQTIRRLNIGSILLVGASGLILLSVIVLNSLMPPYIAFLSIMALLAAMILRLVVLLNKYWRMFLGLPPRNPSLFPPHAYTCPKCGYALRGLHSAFCPECGEVRPAPIDGDEVE